MVFGKGDNQRPKGAADLPMKWHGFLVYCALWISAAGNMVNGILYCIGMCYFDKGENVTGMIYTLFPKLQPIDIGYGALSILLGLFGLYVAYICLTFKKGAPIWLLILYGVGAVLSLAYLMAGNAVVRSNDFVALFPNVSINSISVGVVAFVASAVMIVANFFYYKKRKHLFVK